MQSVEANGASIPIVGLGTWELRGKTCARIVEQALRLGYRHVDTAQAYDNEREVGEGVRASGVPRDQVFVTTKVWWTQFAAGNLERSVAESLARLKLGHIDLLLLHWPNEDVPLKETLDALGRVKLEGLSRHIGVSNFTVALLEQAVSIAPEPIVTDQIELHPFLDQSKVIEACRRHGVAVTAYSPIARGAAKDDAVLQRIGLRHGKSAAQISLRYFVQQEIVVIPRTSRVERLAENADIFDFQLTPGEMDEIRALGSARRRRVDPAWAPNWD